MRILRYGLLALMLFVAPFYAPQAYAYLDNGHYVTSGDVPPEFLAPPPEEGSQGWKRNIQGVLDAQSHMSEQDINDMRYEQKLNVNLLTDVVGADFTREKFPASYKLVDQVYLDAEAIIKADKTYWDTRRPYLTNPHVKLMVNRIDDSPSYPSGHTCDSMVIAKVLGIIFPDRRVALLAKAEAIAFHRIEAGVHYPVDVEGGKLVAGKILEMLVQNKDFQSDLEAAKKEVAASPLFAHP